ncbi:ester cyclase [Candidatus Poriferisocius sp.]|uniref:ester cyclase n=1 Tax=Candidatus Poriferisocius sp. TaxID=3101276 RepID=UPI003B5CA6ED
MTTHDDNKAALVPFRDALYHWTEAGVRSVLGDAFASEALVHLAFPFEALDGPEGFWDQALSKLASAIPDVERRDFIVMAGDDDQGDSWVGCGGHYTGTWQGPFLDIPPTGHQAAMRYHEFFHMVEGRVVEMQALWDIPEMMMQAGVWPMGPSLGRYWHAPAPATQDGVHRGLRDAAVSQASVDWVTGMLTDMGRHPAEPEEVMRLENWWHPKFSWYGPAGIGTGRGVNGFRNWHQIPFLAAMPDRRVDFSSVSHFFGDNDYVGVTAWPGMAMTVTGDGWLGIAPSDREITMRSLDFWRLETDPVTGQRSIRENWVLVDLLHVWNQLGVDVFRRMRELTGPQKLAP